MFTLVDISSNPVRVPYSSLANGELFFDGASHGQKISDTLSVNQDTFAYGVPPADYLVFRRDGVLTYSDPT